jgi:hypothetical protein
MGYYSELKEEIYFDPPLTHKELQKLNPDFFVENWKTDLKIAIEEYSVETEEGTLIKRTGIMLHDPMEESTKHYSFETEMLDIAQKIDLSGGRARGGIVFIGEDNNMSRHFFDKDGKYKWERARIVWEDGSEYRL